MAMLQTCNCGGRARRHRGAERRMHRFAARRPTWNLGLADDRLTKNLEVTRGALLQLITRAGVGSPRAGHRPVIRLTAPAARAGHLEP